MSTPKSSNQLKISMTGTYKLASDSRTSHRRDGTFPADVGIRQKEVLDSILGAVQKAATSKESKTVTVPASPAQGPAVFSVWPADETGWAMINKVALDEPPPLPDVALLRDLFELTPSEAEIAVDLLTHDELDAIASSRNISLETVRMHVKNVLRKTDMRSQKKLLALLTRLGSLRVVNNF
jgi:DNA-binding CsgD family transcriptional regulator